MPHSRPWPWPIWRSVLGAERKHEEAWPTVAVFRLKELATGAGVALNTVYEFEKGRRTPAAYIITAMQAAIEAQGIRLLFDDTGAPAGVARRDVRIELSEAGADQSGG
jgi:hypothetical protein